MEETSQPEYIKHCSKKKKRQISSQGILLFSEDLNCSILTPLKPATVCHWHQWSLNFILKLETFLWQCKHLQKQHISIQTCIQVLLKKKLKIDSANPKCRYRYKRQRIKRPFFQIHILKYLKASISLNIHLSLLEKRIYEKSLKYLQ